MPLWVIRKRRSVNLNSCGVIYGLEKIVCDEVRNNSRFSKWATYDKLYIFFTFDRSSESVLIRLEKSWLPACVNGNARLAVVLVHYTLMVKINTYSSGALYTQGSWKTRRFLLSLAVLYNRILHLVYQVLVILLYRCISVYGSTHVPA